MLQKCNSPLSTASRAVACHEKHEKGGIARDTFFLFQMEVSWRAASFFIK